MRKITLVAWVLTISSLLGCVGNQKAVLKATTQTRRDVFRVVQSIQVTPGKALLKIEFKVKNFKDRFFNTYAKYSNPPYTVIVNVDGQPVELTDEPVLEDLPGDFKNNPEAGTGWKYVFKKTLELEPGTHQITIAIPLSDIVVEKLLILDAGENLLKIEPKYNTSVSKSPHYPRFSKGLRGISVQLNSTTL